MRNAKRLALVLGNDLTDGGQALGPGTIARTDFAMQWARKHGYRLMVAASVAPYLPRQTQTMAEMMREHMLADGFPDEDIVVGLASVFNTRGELWAFAGQPGALALISDQAHLRRTKEIIRAMVGTEAANGYEYVPVPGRAMSLKSRMLEPLKWVYIHLPWFVREPAIKLLWKLKMNTA